MSDHIQLLEPMIRKLGESITSLDGENRTAALLKIIHQPGWTTPQELALVQSMLQHITAQVAAADAAHAALLTVAAKIGR